MVKKKRKHAVLDTPLEEPKKPSREEAKAMRKKKHAILIVKRKAKKGKEGEFLEPEDVEPSPEEIQKERAKRIADRAYHDLKDQRFESAYKLYNTAAGDVPKDSKEKLTYLWYAGIARSKLAVAGSEKWLTVMNHFKKLSERASGQGEYELSDSAFYYASLALIYAKLHDAEVFAKEREFDKAVKTCEEVEDIQKQLSEDEGAFKEQKKMLEIFVGQKKLSYEMNRFRKVEVLAKKVGFKDSRKAKKFRELRYNKWYEFSQKCSEDLEKINKLPKTIEVFETKRDIIANTAEALQGLYLASPNPDTDFLPGILSLYDTAAKKSSELYDSTKNFRYRGEQMIYEAKKKNLRAGIEEFGDIPERVFEKDIEVFEKSLSLQKEIDKVEKTFEEGLAEVEHRLPRYKGITVDKEFWKDAEKEAKDMEKKLEAETKATRETEIDRHAEIIKQLEKERAAESGA